MIHYCRIETPLGELLAKEADGALAGLWFQDQKYYPEIEDLWIEDPSLPLFVELKKHLQAYFSGEGPSLGIPLEPKGTPFQKEVWELLLGIPEGETRTYGELAKKIAEGRGIEKMSTRAVGSAIGRNPISVLIPCHRVIGADGSLTGYAGGLDRKRALLELEKR